MHIRGSLVALVVVMLVVLGALGAGGCDGLQVGPGVCSSCIDHTDTSASCDGNIVVSKTIYDDCPESCATVTRAPCGANEVCIDIYGGECRSRCNTNADCPGDTPHCTHYQGQRVCGAHECFENEDCPGKDAYCSDDSLSCGVALHAGEACGPSGSPAPCAYPFQCLAVDDSQADYACR